MVRVSNKAVAFAIGLDHSTSDGKVILLEKNDEWAVQRSRHMTLESITPIGDDGAVSLPTLVA